MFAPAKTPAPIVQRMATELSAVLQMPEVQQRLKEGGATPGTGTPQSFAAYLKKEKASYAAIVKSANIQQE